MRTSHFFPLIYLLVAITACQVVEPNRPDDSNSSSSSGTTDVIPDIDYSTVFATPASDHTWCFAKDVSFDVKIPKGTRAITVYGRYLDHIYKVYEKREPTENETVRFCVPEDLTTFDVVIDRYYFVTDGSQDIDASNPDYTHLVDSWHYKYATTLGWIMAADCAVNPDFDYNDIVARFEPTFDGTVSITAMASGSPERMWLHYFDGNTDYIISPWTDNGYCVPTSQVTSRNCLQYSWLNWFAKDMEGIGNGFTVNTYGRGMVTAKGATVTVPLTLTNGLFNPHFLSISTMSNKGKDIYARPTMGYYVSVGVYDIDRKDELLKEQDLTRTMSQCVMCVWPRGEQPQMFIIPDTSGADTEQVHTGWQWPTEGSRIDFIYADFTNWIKNPAINWFAEEPTGWPNKVALIDKYGAYLYYGYYQRQPSDQ